MFKIDPAGHSMGYKAIAAGAKEQEAINHLEKEHKKTDGKYSFDQTIQTAISTLQTVVGTDFKPTELEVGVANADKPYFRKLDTETIEHHLNVIADDN